MGKVFATPAGWQGPKLLVLIGAFKRSPPGEHIDKPTLVVTTISTGVAVTTPEMRVVLVLN